jgi:hypothetical protein
VFNDRTNPHGADKPPYLKSFTIEMDGRPTSELCTGKNAAFTIQCEGVEAFSEPCYRINVRNELDQSVLVSDSRMAEHPPHGSKVSFEIESLPLLPGRYFVDVSVGFSKAKNVLDYVLGAATFEVLPGESYGHDYQITADDANIYLMPSWREA